jgi:hypothetical protein
MIRIKILPPTGSYQTNRGADWASAVPVLAALRYFRSDSSAFFDIRCLSCTFQYLLAGTYCAPGFPLLALSINSATSADDVVSTQTESPSARINPGKTTSRIMNPSRNIKMISIAEKPTHDIRTLPFPERTTGNLGSGFRRPLTLTTATPLYTMPVQVPGDACEKSFEQEEYPPMSLVISLYESFLLKKGGTIEIYAGNINRKKSNCRPKSNYRYSIRMIHDNKLVVVMPAYNAEKTLRQTYHELPHEYIDEIILVDDASQDSTTEISSELGIRTIIHRENMGYGANQKTCYREAMRLGADIVVMIHPDYQYSPKLVTAMASMIASGHYDIVLGSRILGRGALAGGMPLYKYIGNRFLTLVENLALGVKLSEFHTGYRAFSRRVLELLPIGKNSDHFVFDNEMLAQAVYFGFKIGEISCPTNYFPDASSINFSGSVIYGLGVLGTSIRFILHRAGLRKFEIFIADVNKIDG